MFRKQPVALSSVPSTQPPSPPSSIVRAQEEDFISKSIQQEVEEEKALQQEKAIQRDKEYNLYDELRGFVDNYNKEKGGKVWPLNNTQKIATSNLMNLLLTISTKIALIRTAMDSTVVPGKEIILIMSVIVVFLSAVMIGCTIIGFLVQNKARLDKINNVIFISTVLTASLEFMLFSVVRDGKLPNMPFLNAAAESPSPTPPVEIKFD